MQPASPAGLGIAPDSCLLELVMESQCCLPNVSERRRLARIQVKNGLIGLGEVRDMGTPEVEFDGPLVGEPDEARCIVDQWQSNQVRARLGTVRYPPEPVGSRVRAVAQVVRFSIYPLGEHAQRHWTVFEIGERRVRDLPVIVQQIAFGEPRLWPVAFLKVRYLYGLASQLPRFRGGTHTDGLLTIVLAVAVFTV